MVGRTCNAVEIFIVLVGKGLGEFVTRRGIDAWLRHIGTTQEQRSQRISREKDER